MTFVRTLAATLICLLVVTRVSAQDAPEATIPEPAPSSWVAPERHADLFELELGLDAGFALPRNRIAASLLGRASVTYRGAQRFYVRGALGPSGGVQDEPQRITTGTLTAGFDSRFVEVGGGVGVARSADPCATENCDRRDRSYAAPTMVAELRLGTRDGLHVAGRLTVARLGDRMRIGAGELTLHAPVSRRVAAYSTLTLAADEIGYRRYETGFRIRVRGDGGSGSLYVTPGAAWTGYALDAIDDEMYVNAFSGVLALEYRL